MSLEPLLISKPTLAIPRRLCFPAGSLSFAFPVPSLRGLYKELGPIRMLSVELVQLRRFCDFSLRLKVQAVWGVSALWWFDYA